ncbi:MAG: rolling circle replication-associated protein [Pontibacterium sp.]
MIDLNPQKAPFTLLPNDGKGVFSSGLKTNRQLVNDYLYAKKNQENLAVSGFSSSALDAEVLKLAGAVKSRQHAPALSEATRNRLVEGCKSPTQKKELNSGDILGLSEAQERQLHPETAKAFAKRALAHLPTEAQKQAEHEKRQRQREMADYLVESGAVTAEEADAQWKKRLTKADIEAPRFAGVDFDTGELLRVAPKSQSGDGKFTVISHREWSGEYRIRTQAEMPAGLPPMQEGVRISHHLSERGARNIADSCHFMHLKHGGYRTFMTLTLDDAGRCRVEERVADGPCCEVELGKVNRLVKPAEYKPKTTHWVDDVPLNVAKFDGPACELVAIDGRLYAAANAEAGDDMTYQTIQKELSRFLDGMQKMKKRGWIAAKSYPWGVVTCYEREGKRVEEKPSKVVGIKGFLADKKISLVREGVKYCWVVENPLNEKGKRNPHIHLLCDWRVKYSRFASWVKRLEELWGHGFNHVEKIKDTASAGAYIAKACGYLSKAADEDQGPVRGNRYGISAASRAPEWACIGRYELSIMGHLIKDVSEYFTHSYASELRQRRNLKDALDNTPKDEKHKRDRLKIGRALSKVRDKIKALPAIPSKFQLVLKGAEPFADFMQWAKGQDVAAPWLPEKHKDDVWQHDKKPDGLWLSEFQFRLFARKAVRRWAGIPLSVYSSWELEGQEQETPTIGHWLEYESMAA